MTEKTPEKVQARALQQRTGWSYSECLRCVRKLTVAEIEALVRALVRARKEKG